MNADVLLYLRLLLGLDLNCDPAERGFVTENLVCRIMINVLPCFSGFRVCVLMSFCYLRRL